ncbi:hypothetical protein JDV02_007245 [Purpureocillium takamizusanense]|uniref:Uncharacterized protein n=1 Tax=Purpureocillium takamizusanense TaxID=2060973 RepID=A0A9Q8QLB3_9HYPO|nr:uncharacterized protein JDV02_007245 [Purpureocillium takamizusanense]UNI21236.1 hypothetical protein JDV02_007245 [Purpureocillium takamizusanense]
MQALTPRYNVCLPHGSPGFTSDEHTPAVTMARRRSSSRRANFTLSNISIISTPLLTLLLILLSMLPLLLPVAHAHDHHPLQASPGDDGGSLSPNLPRASSSSSSSSSPTTTTTTQSSGPVFSPLHQRDDAPPPPYQPIVTPPPDQAERLASMGYRQETFYTCNTVGGREHCGWHNPVVVAAAEAAPGRRPRAAGSGAVVAAVGCLAGVFALGMM